jgi:hydrogenase large subunit
MLAVFGGKMPHNMSVVPGGVTEVPTADKIASFLWKLNRLRDFIDNVYLPDVLRVAETYSDYFEIGTGCGNLLSYGVFDLDGSEPDLTRRERLLVQGTIGTDLQPGDVDASRITEHITHSWFDDATTGKHPAGGETVPDGRKENGYSWLKSPRYDDRVFEVGPLARMAVTYAKGNGAVGEAIDGVLGHFDAGPEALFSVLGRHAARALEAKIVADSMAEWVLELKPGEPVAAPFQIPEEAQGMGIVGGPRGALGHWISIKEHKIDRYQLVVPTTWNCSPRDDNGNPGPVEQALIGTKIKDVENPFEVVRIVRAFDPCLACAVHLVTPKGRTLEIARVS